MALKSANVTQGVTLADFSAIMGIPPRSCEFSVVEVFGYDALGLNDLNR